MPVSAIVVMVITWLGIPVNNHRCHHLYDEDDHHYHHRYDKDDHSPRDYQSMMTMQGVSNSEGNCGRICSKRGSRPSKV